MPAVYRELCLDAQLAEQLAGGPLSFARGKLGAAYKKICESPAPTTTLCPSLPRTSCSTSCSEKDCRARSTFAWPLSDIVTRQSVLSVTGATLAQAKDR